MGTRRQDTPPLMMALLAGIVIGTPIGVIMKGSIGQGAPVVGAADGDRHPMTPTSRSGSAAAIAFQGADARMHSGMVRELTGDVDLDFAKGMIPHHQGAVDMALIEIEHGSDPTMRALARKVVSTQQDEIETLREWSSGK